LRLNQNAMSSLAKRAAIRPWNLETPTSVRTTISDRTRSLGCPRTGATAGGCRKVVAISQTQNVMHRNELLSWLAEQYDRFPIEPAHNSVYVR
jgi:hypothetical protein